MILRLATIFTYTVLFGAAGLQRHFLGHADKPAPTLNLCGYCRATSYHRVAARDGAGAMRYTEILQCTGSGREFAKLQVWRQGGTQEQAGPPVAQVH